VGRYWGDDMDELVTPSLAARFKEDAENSDQTKDSTLSGALKRKLGEAAVPDRDERNWAEVIALRWLKRAVVGDRAAIQQIFHLTEGSRQSQLQKNRNRG
jgi:hypothetical protein